MDKKWRELWNNLLVGLGALTFIGVTIGLLIFMIWDFCKWIKN